ncbi:uncharacterized protein LOC122364408 [Amphibalanus amphitrite]|uniref:uncharacterized protein LOC122364408 n=1 Tax=Amphibalanus amphitrite TaxID=1232801 RepID=UPI001C8FB79B|nr:uncharacterized protein LOC122364408 [Amphibalanus amphitrite]
MVGCCVPGCSSTVGGHKIPREEKLRKTWLVKIRREGSKRGSVWKPSASSVVCRKHFTPNDYMEPSWTSKMAGIVRKQLKKDAVPSIFPWTSAKNKVEVQRRARSKQRQHTSKQEDVAEEPDATLDRIGNFDTVEEVVAENDYHENAEVADESAPQPERADKSVQAEQSSVNFSVDRFSNNDKAIKFYTGFDSFEHFQIVFDCLGPAAHRLQYYPDGSACTVIPPLDCFFITLVKLKRNKELFELSMMYDVSVSLISNIVITWVNFMYREFLDMGLGCGFGAGRSEDSGITKVIIDCTEVATVKPGNVIAQQATYSTYKSTNTMKTLVAITPSGIVTHVSQTYGGSTSDNAIVQESGLLESLGPGAEVIADRGFTDRCLAESRSVKLVTPASMKGRGQLPPSERAASGALSSRRIHVERVIGLAKTYAILRGRMCVSQVKLSTEIVYICFMLANFRRNIVK